MSNFGKSACCWSNSSAGIKRGSFSITITLFAPSASKLLVNPPGPGPISIMVPPLRFGSCLTNLTSIPYQQKTNFKSDK